MDVLLVLGSVTSEQYGRIRLAMLRMGLKPKIVRVPAEYATTDAFRERALDEWQTNGKPIDWVDVDEWQTNDKSIDRVDVRAAEIEIDLMKRCFGDAQVSDVKAVVVEPKLDDNSEDRGAYWDWLTDQVPEDVATYLVRLGESGGFYLDGFGFGRL